MAGCRQCDYDACLSCAQAKAKLTTRDEDAHAHAHTVEGEGAITLPPPSPAAATGNIADSGAGSTDLHGQKRFHKPSFATWPQIVVQTATGCDEEVEALIVPGGWQGRAEDYFSCDSSGDNEDGGVVGRPPSPQFVAFLRDVIGLVEVDLGVGAYHLRLCVGRNAEELQQHLSHSKFELLRRDGVSTDAMACAVQAGCFVLIAGRRRIDSDGRIVPSSVVKHDRDAANEKAFADMHRPMRYTDRKGTTVALPISQQDICVQESKLARTFLDAQVMNKIR